MAIPFNSGTLGRPQAASAVDDSATAGNGPGIGQAVGIVGVAQRGKPLSATPFTSPAAARAFYGLGSLSYPLIDGIDRAFAAGASRVYGVRLGGATQASVNLLSGASAVINVKTKEYGVLANSWFMTVANGSDIATYTTSRKITLNTNDGFQYPVDNIHRRGITLSYNDTVGNTTTKAPTVVIAYSAGVTTITLAVASGAVAGDNTTLTSTNYPTLRVLVDAINNTGRWVATIVNELGDAELTTTLDEKTSTAVPSVQAAAPNEKIYLNCDVDALLDTLNGTLGTVLEATLTDPVGVITNGTYLFSGAASDGTIDATAWGLGLDALKNVDTPLVCVMTGDAAIHASTLTHCVNASNVSGKRERIAILGGVAGESVATVKARVPALNSKRAALVWPGPKDLDRSGLLTTYPPFYMAATIAGQFAAQPSVADPLTRKPVGVLGIETIATPTELDDLVNAGVLAIEYVDGRGFRVVQSVSSWLGDTNYARREVSTARGVDYVSRSVREALDAALVGQKAGPGVVSAARNTTENVLLRMASEGVIVGSASTPAYRNIQVRLVGDALYVDFEAAVAIPTNYVLITAHLRAYGT